MYAVLATLKSYLGITETTDDTLLGVFLATAQAAIDTFCGQSFEALADSTRHFSAASYRDDSWPWQNWARSNSQFYAPVMAGAVDGLTLTLDAPLCQVTSVTNGDGTTVSAASYSTLPLNDTPYYALYLKRSSGLRWTYSTDVESDLIAITGRWSYSVSAPADIAHATLRMAAYLYRQKNNSGDLDRPLAIGGGAALLPPELPKDLKFFLAPYVRIVS